MSDERPVAVLTGAGSGIGAATAVRLAEAGLRVVLVGRNRPALTALSGRLPHDPEIVEVDLADTEDLAERTNALAEQLGSVAVLVNCAGTMLNRRAERTSVQDLNRVFAVNLTAPFVLCKGLLPALRSARGCVVNVVSVSALMGVAAQSAYSASKGALVALTRSMAAEWGGYGVRVNAVAPGITVTPMSAAYAVPPYKDHISRNVPLGRWAEPDDVATTIAFLCSDGARYVTGQVITVDGGLSSLYWLSTTGRDRDAGNIAVIEPP